MHPRIEELLEHLDVHRAALRRAVDEIPADHLGRQPADGRWSVVNVIEHLTLVETRVAGLLHKRIQEARAAGLGAETETSSVLAQSGLEHVTNRAHVLAAPEAVQPKSTLDAAAAWRGLEEAREKLRGVLMLADGFAVGEITHPHAYFGPLTAYQWFAFIAGHEARHTAQIREIAAALSA